MKLHSQVENYILERIRSGELKPGDAIETERELEEKFQISRPTVRQALNKLTAMGYLNRIKGKGTFINKPKNLHRSSSVIESYRQEVGNRKLNTRVDCLRTLPADDSLAEHLHIRRRAQVVELVRTRRIEDDKPVVYTRVYVPYNRFPGIMDIDFREASLYESLDEQGLRVVHVTRTIEMLPPTAEIAEKLEISPFEPVFYVVTHGYTENEQIIEYSESYYPGSSSTFKVDLHR